jgi:hypothetical protein
MRMMMALEIPREIDLKAAPESFKGTGGRLISAHDSNLSLQNME